MPVKQPLISPSKPPDNPTNVWSGNPILFCKMFICAMIWFKNKFVFNSSHLFGRKLSFPIAKLTLAPDCSPPSFSVIHIILLCSSIKMFWINTCWNITMMKNIKIIRYVSFIKNKTKSMRPNGCACFWSKNAISTIAFTARPQPTFSSYANIFQKSFFNFSHYMAVA